MTPVDSCAAVMRRLSAGEGEAAGEVFRRFAVQLFALAQRQRRFTHRLEAEDVVQSAFKSFFHRQRQGKLEIASWGSLWGLLTVITLRKCADRAERYRAARRDERREVSAASGPHPWEVALDRAPLPHEAAVLAEAVDCLFRCVEADERPVLQLSLQGHTAAEVSLQLGRALRSVQRVREKIRKRLERMQQEA